MKTLSLITILMNAVKFPDELLKNFLILLDVRGVRYNVAKCLATFRASSQALVTGLSSVTFFNTSYPDSEHFLIVGVRAYSGVNAVVGSTPWVPGISDALAVNGFFTITNNGSVEIKDMPLTSFVLSTGNSDTEGGFLVLDKAILWVGQTVLSLTTNFPTVTATATFNLRFELEGIKFI